MNPGDPSPDTVHPTQGGSHGDHWQGVFGDRTRAALELAQEAFRQPIGRGTVRHDGRAKELLLARAEAAPGVDVVAAALDGGLVTAFPVVREAAPEQAATVTSVAPWPDGLEAWVEVHLKGLGYLSYFPTDYIPKQARYHEAANAEAEGTAPPALKVALSGLAYTLQPGTEDDKDDFAPASDFIPKAYPDDYWWSGRVVSVHDRADGYLLDVLVEPEEGVHLELPVHVAAPVASQSERPKAGDRASGFLWLQGHLAESTVRR